MWISNFLERKTLDVLRSIFKLPTTNFRTKTYKEYLLKRKNTINGFIGYQVPRKGIDRIYRNDFVVYIPNKLDLRIECKSLDIISALSRAVVTEEKLISDSMPENELILLTEGEGFKSKEFVQTINKSKSETTRWFHGLTSMFNELNSILN